MKSRETKAYVDWHNFHPWPMHRAERQLKREASFNARDVVIANLYDPLREHYFEHRARVMRDDWG
jgi:hypothetical protein